MENGKTFTNPADKRKHDLFVQKVSVGYVKHTTEPLARYRAEQVAKKLMSDPPPGVLNVMAIPVPRANLRKRPFFQPRRKKVA